MLNICQNNGYYLHFTFKRSQKGNEGATAESTGRYRHFNKNNISKYEEKVRLQTKEK